MMNGIYNTTSAAPSDQPPVTVHSILAAIEKLTPDPAPWLSKLRSSVIAPPGMMILKLHGEIAWWGRVGDPDRFGVEFDEVLLHHADFAALQARAAS
jgi:hypothetical protein